MLAELTRVLSIWSTKEGELTITAANKDVKKPGTVEERSREAGENNNGF